MENENQLLVIFGASGDLTARKLIPALFNLYLKNLLPNGYAILGVGRSSFSDKNFRKKVVFENEFLLSKNGKDARHLKKFADLIFYKSINTSNPNDFARAANVLS